MGVACGEQSRGRDAGQMACEAPPGHDLISWRAKWKVEKYNPGRTPADGAPDEVIHGEGNLLLNVGIAVVLDKLIGAGSADVFDNTNSHIGVGDDNTAAAAGQTDLQASSNKLRKAMDATYPSRASQTVTWRSTFGSSDANWAWREFIIANHASAGIALNRKVQDLGTKASGATWVFSVTVTLS